MFPYAPPEPLEKAPAGKNCRFIKRLISRHLLFKLFTRDRNSSFYIKRIVEIRNGLKCGILSKLNKASGQVISTYEEIAVLMVCINCIICISIGDGPAVYKDLSGIAVLIPCCVKMTCYCVEDLNNSICEYNFFTVINYSSNRTGLYEIIVGI